MAAKKKAKKKHPGKKHGGHAKKAKKHGGHAKKHAKHPKTIRCASCGHSARHSKAGCTHFDGKRFCPCKHRG
jgi:hypothetical protein